MKKFEELENVRELIDYVRMNGVPTDQEKICRMQDIVGHSSEQELASLANNDGTEEKDGQKWSTGRRGTRADFYHLLFHIWNWEDAVRFFNRHTDPTIKAMRANLQKVNAEYDSVKKLYENEHLERTAVEKIKAEHFEALCKADKELVELKKELEAKDLEIMKLKAKLYDFLAVASAAEGATDK